MARRDTNWDAMRLSLRSQIDLSLKPHCFLGGLEGLEASFSGFKWFADLKGRVTKPKLGGQVSNLPCLHHGESLQNLTHINSRPNERWILNQMWICIKTRVLMYVGSNLLMLTNTNDKIKSICYVGPSGRSYSSLQKYFYFPELIHSFIH